MARKGSGRIYTFTYMDETYSLSPENMGRLFGVSYDSLNRRHRDGMTDQEIADWAAEKGGHKPRQYILLCRFLRTRLVPV